MGENHNTRDEDDNIMVEEPDIMDEGCSMTNE
jgi:hypothetical protein